MLIIDRFEGNYAVIEINDEYINIPKSELPKNAKEGDVLVISVDSETADERKKNMRERLDKIFNK